MGRRAWGVGSRAGATELGQNNDGLKADIDILAQKWMKWTAE